MCVASQHHYTGVLKSLWKGPIQQVEQIQHDTCNLIRQLYTDKLWVYGKFTPVWVHTDVTESTVEVRYAHSTTKTNNNPNPYSCYRKSLVPW